MPDRNLPLGRILAGLKRVTTDAVIIDNDHWQPARILTLAEQIASVSGAREKIASLTENPAIMAATLIAAQKQGNDLLLVRDRSVATEDFFTRMGIATVIDIEGKVNSRTRGGRPGRGRVLLMTSGTTGTPKIVAHGLEALIERIPVAPEISAVASWLLTYHLASFAGLQVLLTALVSGTTLVATLQSGIAALVEVARKHKITFASGTPTFWRSFLTACGRKTNEIPLRIITLGGETADQPTLDRLHMAWPKAKLVHIYASTEGGSVFAVKDGRAGFPALWLESGIEGYHLRLHEGMLEIKGSRLMQGYESDTLSPVTDGWLKTGDLCVLAGDRAFFVGREDSMINVGGSKVSPEAVETALLRLSLVHDARVFGKRNPITGMLVAAEIVLSQPTEDTEAARKAVLDHARAVLQPFEVPQILTFVPHITATAGTKKVRQ
jgi:acyl-coenzyme A synthetase/AMP-(fatty) acid ligase